MQPRSDQPRSSGPADPACVRFDRFRLDEANASLLRDGTPVARAPTPSAVLCARVRKPGSLLTKNALRDEAWGHQFVSEAVPKTVISELRTVLGVVRIVACINCVWLLDAADEREIVERYLRTLRKAAAKSAVRLAC